MKKRIVALLMSLCMILSLAVNAFAAGESMQVTLRADKTGPLKAGDTVTVTLNIKASTGLTAIQGQITSDNDNLTIADNTNITNTFPESILNSFGVSLTDKKLCSIVVSYPKGTTAELNGDCLVVKYTATADINVPVTFTFSTVKVAFGVGTSSKNVEPTGIKSATVNVAISGDLPITITAPANGNPPQATIADGTGYTGTISWTPGHTNFQPSTSYTATVTLTARDGYQFDSSAMPKVTGATKVTKTSNTGSTLSFTVTFPKTADKPALQGTISLGEAKVAEQLTATVSGLTNVTYQWYVDDKPVAGATGTSYTPVAADYGKKLKLVATATGDSEYAGSVTSNVVTVGCDHAGGTANCQEAKTCTTCGNKYGEKDSTVHASSETYYVKTATTHQKMHKCCETPAEATSVNHTWSNGVCSVCEYECKHDYSYTKIDGQDKHTKACKLCDVSEAVPCSGGTATCTARPICKDCNTAYSVTVPHKTGKVEAKAATCLVAGNKEYWVCSTCLRYFEDEAATKPIEDKSGVIIAAKGHHYGTGYVSDATGHWHICADCGAKDTVEQHTFKDGTPTETEAKKCLTCGYVAANPTGEHKTHNPSQKWNGFDDNYHWRTCDNCNEKIDKTAHDFDTAVIDKPATKTEAGQQHKVCKTCGYIKCEAIPATGTTGGTTGGNGNNANAKNPYEKNDTTKKDNGKTVESGRTFDAGIALYVGLSLLSVTGGALVIGKKKEF